MKEPAADERSVAFGLIERKTRWRLSNRGWAVLLLAVFAACLILFLCVEPFLSVTHRVPSKILVVEGWVPYFVLQEGWAEFERGHYDIILTTGGPLRKWPSVEPGDTKAIVAAAQLMEIAKTKAPIFAVSSPKAEKDRTYVTAVAVRDWVLKNQPGTKSFNVMTLGVHARRTRLMYQKAFGSDFTVGSISVPDDEFDPKHWWKYSEGVKEVICEAIAYVYARLFFFPA